MSAPATAHATVSEVSALCHAIRLERRSLPDTPLPRFLRAYVPTIAPFIAMLGIVSWFPSAGSWIALAVVAGVTQNALGILTHEAAHFFLHRDRGTNDRLADWLVCLPIFNTVAGYRRDHFEHHRGCCGPRDPYYGLYGPYERRSDVARGFIQDVTGLTAVRSFLARYSEPAGINAAEVGPDTTAVLRILIVQALIAAMMLMVTGRWWAYPLAWVLPLVTVPFAVNRVRTFVEHHADPRGPEATRTTLPTLIEWITVAPYGYAHHFEHHLMPDVPYYHLGWAHEELSRRGFTFGGEHLSSGGYLSAFVKLVKELR